MTDNAKIITATCAAGAVFAAAPTVYGTVRNLMPKPVNDGDTLKIENGAFVNANGKTVLLRGVNLGDEIFFRDNNGKIIDKTVDEYYSSFKERFGAYGAETLIGEYYKAVASQSDLKYILKLGANCVRIPLRYFLLYREPDCKGKPRLDLIDSIVENCRKLGLYVILDLHSVSGDIYASGKDGFEARNAVIRLWSQIAVHYKDEPTVAAYDLLNRPLNGITHTDDKISLLHKFYLRIFKAIRNVDKEKIIIIEAAGFTDSLPNPSRYRDNNVAFGLYSHFHTTFETDALMKDVARLKECGIPFIVCKIRSDKNWNYSLGKLCDGGISWLMGDFKGKSDTSCLYSGNAVSADLENDSYETLTEKCKNTPSTKNHALNKELSKALKLYFSGSRRTEKRKPEIKVKVGFNVVKGV